MGEDGTIFYDSGYTFKDSDKFEFDVMLGKQRAEVGS